LSPPTPPRSRVLSNNDTTDAMANQIKKLGLKYIEALRNAPLDHDEAPSDVRSNSGDRSFDYSDSGSGSDSDSDLNRSSDESLIVSSVESSIKSEGKRSGSRVYSKSDCGLVEYSRQLSTTTQPTKKSR